MRRFITTTLLLTTLALTAPSLASAADTRSGTAVPSYGKTYAVDVTMAMPKGFVLKHSFDRSQGAEPGTINKDIESAARLMNMNHLAGVPLKNINIAVVVHGSAIFDVSNNAFYKKRTGKDSANAGLIKELLNAGVRVIVCGQSAMGRGLPKSEMIPGVELALSAMNAHMVLQQEGYSLNPF